jgi:hypothetical protein
LCQASVGARVVTQRGHWQVELTDSMGPAILSPVRRMCATCAKLLNVSCFER